MGKSILEQAKQDVKNKQKENKTMKNSSKKTVIVTVVVTLLAVAAIVGLVYAGFTFGVGYEKSIDTQVSAQVKDLGSVITAKK